MNNCFLSLFNLFPYNNVIKTIVLEKKYLLSYTIFNAIFKSFSFSNTNLNIFMDCKAIPLLLKEGKALSAHCWPNLPTTSNRWSKTRRAQRRSFIRPPRTHSSHLLRRWNGISRKCRHCRRTLRSICSRRTTSITFARTLMASANSLAATKTCAKPRTCWSTCACSRSIRASAWTVLTETRRSITSPSSCSPSHRWRWSAVPSSRWSSQWSERISKRER